ncbi:hypothetical protein SAMN05192575_11313 [Nocardioides alpinus]|uniref:Uncharacterized protein n=1 Tax=Nocardioides alpinus TaxID=748909 RepID=A0A1I1B2K7_9ACTN|nr:hypothetical protein [Nocardioides alpinus]PKH40149.1 hypothetical protein CXG46_13405 [Nocardioides alpinus]SFB44599.1 hypothetical protein SAMN05192575_11313 [Nocardioides alpinus]
MTPESGLHDSPPPLPRGTRVDFEVECRTSPDSTTGERHTATLLEDWTVLTPHDLEAERVGLAFGGFCDCLALAQSGVRVAQRWWQLSTRHEVPEIAFSPVHGWQPSMTTACACTPAPVDGSPGLRFRTAIDARAHETSSLHLAARGNARPHHARALINALRPVAIDVAPARRDWEPVADRLREPDALKVLWNCGLHPARVAELLDVAPGVTGRLPASFPLGLAFVPDRAMPRRHEVARQRDADLATWLLWDGTAPDPSRPFESGEWLGLGLTPRQCQEMLAAGITATLADELAATLRQPLEDCVRLLLQRPPPGVLPELDHLLAGARAKRDFSRSTVSAPLDTRSTDTPLLDASHQEISHGDPHAH